MKANFKNLCYCHWNWRQNCPLFRLFTKSLKSRTFGIYSRLIQHSVGMSASPSENSVTITGCQYILTGAIQRFCTIVKVTPLLFKPVGQLSQLNFYDRSIVVKKKSGTLFITTYPSTIVNTINRRINDMQCTLYVAWALLTHIALLYKVLTLQRTSQVFSMDIGNLPVIWKSWTSSSHNTRSSDFRLNHSSLCIPVYWGHLQCYKSSNEDDSDDCWCGRNSSHIVEHQNLSSHVLLRLLEPNTTITWTVAYMSRDSKFRTNASCEDTTYSRRPCWV